MYSVSYSVVEISKLDKALPGPFVIIDDHPGLLDESSQQLLDEDGYPIEDESGD